MDREQELDGHRVLRGCLFRSELFHLPMRLGMLAMYFLDPDVRDETKLSNQVSQSNV